MRPYVQVIAALSAVVFVAGTPLHTRAAVSMPADGMADQSSDGDALVPAPDVTRSTDHVLTLDGKRIGYKATAGTLTLTCASKWRVTAKSCFMIRVW
jgi:hypothetical protein